MNDIPKFCAVCIDDDEFITACGTGKTADEAYEEFMSNGEFENHCSGYAIPVGAEVDVKIYSVLAPEESDWPIEELHPDWEWVLHEHVETRTARAI